MKYSHNQVCVDGYLFDSEQEADYYRLLKDKQAHGYINELKPHPTYVLIPPFFYEGKQIKGVEYTPDFTYIENTGLVAVEVKGYPTPDFELRVKLFKWKYPGIHLIVMQYSKATGWMEMGDYRKARKKINAANAVDRYEKRKAKYLTLKAKYEDYLAKAKGDLSVASTVNKKEKSARRVSKIEAKIASIEARWNEGK
jgi:hypothetical protein